MPLDEKTYRTIRRKAQKERQKERLLLDEEENSDSYLMDAEDDECGNSTVSEPLQECADETFSNVVERQPTPVAGIETTTDIETTAVTEITAVSASVQSPSMDTTSYSSSDDDSSDTFFTEDEADWRGYIEDLEEYQNSASISSVCYNVEDPPPPVDLSDLLKELNDTIPSHSDCESVESSLREDLAQWALDYQHIVTHDALNDLLGVLRKNISSTNLPKCAKTLLKTPRNVVKNIKVCAGGFMWYHGIVKGLEKHLQANSSLILEDSITIDVHVDGVSPYKSVKKCLWPITCCADGGDPFLVAVWCGTFKDPTDPDEFLQDFITEAKVLINNGFVWRDRLLKLHIRRIIADAPARAWLRKVNQHGSKVCCERCTVRGEGKDGRMTYNVCTLGDLRSDESFVSLAQPEYHDLKKGTSSLLELGIGMITQVPLDGMHLNYLGVMKRMLAMLLLPKASQHKLNKAKTSELSDILTSLTPCFPSEFGRKPRALLEWKLYKATELRRILFYDGLLLFKKVNSHVFMNFLQLHCALRILNDEDFKQYNADANLLLEEFVKTASSCELYTQTFNVNNVHHLIHLAEDCKRHGVLDEFSAFKYENFLGSLKNILRAPVKTLGGSQQVPVATDPRVRRRIQGRVETRRIAGGDS